ncbi:unnamed protein product [Ilex paraguariensis]|uniref:BAG domain-containing protein n=1 Tax=Ilex paraguariensis TaxID=185542 RepID=A0ABC8S8Z2_9AQUA
MTGQQSEENSGSEVGSKVMDKNAVKKIIPVKQVQQHEEKKASEEGDREARGVPVMLSRAEEKISSEDSAKRLSSSPLKTAKLPSVCLRVDPLPRRKSNKGSSRSPSPPGDKGKQEELSLDGSKSPTSTVMKESSERNMQSPDCTLDYSKEVEPCKTKTKTIKVVEGTARQERNDLDVARTEGPFILPLKSQEARLGDNVMEGKNSGQAIEPEKATLDGQICDDAWQSGEDKEATKSKEDNTDEAHKGKRKKLSDAEAVTIIQSAYCGFELRKGEPLKKLKQMAEVGEQMAEVKKCIHAFESSSDLEVDEKQKAAIGETIMGLLLKLDTIQGLHPSIRDVRKSVARELVSLQEKLDSLTMKKIQQPIEQAAKPVEDFPSEPLNEACIQGGQEAKVEPEFSESGISNKTESVEQCQGELLLIADGVSGSKAAETSGATFVDKEVCGDLKDRAMELQVTRCPLPSALEEKINCPLEVALSSYLVDDSIHIDKGIQNVIGQDSEVRESHKCELDVNELAKLPQEVFDENPEVQELENYRPTETGKDAALQGGLVYSQTAVDTSSPDITQVKQQPQEALEEGLVPAAMVD